MSSQIVCDELIARPHQPAEVLGSERRWYAVFIVPQNEKSAVKHLQLRDIESFLPTYETFRVWKNRQRVKTVLPLFPCYLFVRVNRCERSKVLQTPGVLHILGNGRVYAPLEEAEIQLLRLGLQGRRLEPFRGLLVGEKVRVKTGVMQGLEGTLVRKNNSLRFVLCFNLVNQCAAVEVDADALEAVLS